MNTPDKEPDPDTWGRREINSHVCFCLSFCSLSKITDERKKEYNRSKKIEVQMEREKMRNPVGQNGQLVRPS